MSRISPSTCSSSGLMGTSLAMAPRSASQDPPTTQSSGGGASSGNRVGVSSAVSQPGIPVGRAAVGGGRWEESRSSQEGGGVGASRWVCWARAELRSHAHELWRTVSVCELAARTQQVQ